MIIQPPGTVNKEWLMLDEDSKADKLDGFDLIASAREACASILVGTENQQQMARSFYNKLLTSQKDNERLWATKMLLCAPNVENKTDKLIKYLDDSNYQVVKNVIETAAIVADSELTISVFSKLSDPFLRETITHSFMNVPEHSHKQAMKLLSDSKDEALSIHLIIFLAQLNVDVVEKDLLRLCDFSDALLSHVACVHLAYRSLRWPLQANSKFNLKRLLENIIDLAGILIQSRNQADDLLEPEIDSRLRVVKINYLSLLAAYCDQRIILTLIPSLVSFGTKYEEHAKAIELLEISLDEFWLKKSAAVVLEEVINNNKPAVELANIDDWFSKLAKFNQNALEEKDMDTINKVLVLRKLKLFKQLLPEVLMLIAKNLERVELQAGDIIFEENDSSNGLYILAKGSIEISQRQRGVIAENQAPDYFGELGLLDDEPRYARVVATSECELYFLDKLVFSRLIDEQPEILRALVKTLISYYRHAAKVITGEHLPT